MKRTDGEAIEPPETARAVFGDQLAGARRFAAALADAGVVRGLIGPREVPRLWDRHLLNCAVLAPALPERASVCDLGAGAGLPGVVLAMLRPDVSMTLLEPLLRRTTFLSEVVADLKLPNVRVVRARAEEEAARLRGGDGYRVVVARAVARLDRLAAMALPLCAAGGALLAIKGASARDEISAAAPRLPSLGAARWSVEQYGVDVLQEPTTVIRIVAKNGRAITGR